MNRAFLIAVLMCICWPVISRSDAIDHFSKLTWPPTAKQGREIGEEIRAVLKWSEIPEAKSSGLAQMTLNFMAL